MDDENNSISVHSVDTVKSARFRIGYDSTDEDIPTHQSYEETTTSALKRAVKKLVNRKKSPILGLTGDQYFEPPSQFNEETGMVNIRRPIYSQSKFNKVFEENINEREIRFLDNVVIPIRGNKNIIEILYSIFPLIAVVKKYSIKTFLPFDILAGITTAVTRIPQSMAYALLANLTPVSGLYTAFFSAVLYPIFGGSNHMAAGAQGVVSLLIGGGVVSVLNRENLTGAISSSDRFEGSNNSTNSNDGVAVDVVTSITFMVGMIQCLFGICRLGFLTNYLSDPLVGGFTTAAAVDVVVSQTAIILGIKVNTYSGIFNKWKLIIEICKKITSTNLYTLGISVVCIAALIIFKLINSKITKKIKIPIPGELLVMIGMVVFSNLMYLDKRWKVSIVGHLARGFAAPRLPNPKYMFSTIGTSFSTAIVSFAIGYSIAKRFALKHDYEISGNQEIFAFGFVNSVSSCFSCFASTASMSASCLHESLGGKSQIANYFSSIIILCTLLFLGFLFESVPECVLSTIILTNLNSFLMQFFDLKVLWKVSKFDFLLWIVSFLSVVILDVDIGLGVGVMFSLITIVFRTQWPYTCLLGRIPCTDIYKNITLTPDAEEVTGIKIFRFEGSLYFASAEHFRNSIQSETDINPLKIINANRERESKLLKVKQQAFYILEHERIPICPSDTHLLEQGIIDLNIKEIHHIIIDFSTCGFIDSVGVRTLMHVIHDYKMAGICVFLANVRAAVRAMLIDSSVLYKTVNPRNMFLSVHDAVLGALEDEKFITERNYIIENAAIKSGTRCVSRIASDPDINRSTFK